MENFIKKASGISPSFYKSPGSGWDYRFEGEGITGSALVYHGEVIHAAFYSKDYVRNR